MIPPYDVPVNGILQFENIQGLQQVIQSTETDCFDRIFIESCCEDHIEVPRSGFIEKIKSIHTRHFNIEHDQRWLVFIQQSECLSRILFATDLMFQRHIYTDHYVQDDEVCFLFLEYEY